MKDKKKKDKPKVIDGEARSAFIEESHRRLPNKRPGEFDDEGEGDAGREGEEGRSGGGLPERGDEGGTYKQILEALSDKPGLDKTDFSLLSELRTIIASNPELLGKVRNLNEFLAELEEQKVVGLDGKPLTEAEKEKLAQDAKKLKFDRKDKQYKKGPPTPSPF